MNSYFNQLSFILNLAYFCLPAFMANMAPVITACLPLPRSRFLKETLLKPLDNGCVWKGKRITGNNKTWQGLFSGVIFGVLTALVQYSLEKKGITNMFSFSAITDFVIYGALSGLGALIGDAFFSFIKRRLDIKSGRPFIPFDQTDYLIGFLFFTSPFFSWSMKDIIVILTFGLVFNPLTNLLAYAFKLKKTYW